LTITKANATVTANSGLLTYNGANQTVSGFTATGLVGNETAAVLAGVSASRTAKNAGTYAVTPSGTDSNYDLSFVDGSMQIAKANATVTANSASVTYNGVNQTVSGFTATGLVGGETEAVLTGVSASRTAKNAGNYAVMASGTDGNYNLSFVNGNLDIAKAALTATGNSAAVTYNGANQSVGGFTVTGLQGSDTVADLSNVVAAGATAKNAGSYANTVTAGTETNYTVSTLPGSLDIAKANATVSANNATKTYDGSSYTGGNGVAYVGFVNNETEAVLGGNLGYIGTSQGARNAGSYVITPAGLTSSNYAVNFSDGILTISPSGVSAIAVNLTGTTTKVYDGTTAATLTPGNFALTGFAAGEGASVSKTTGTFDNPNVGEGKTVSTTLSNSDFAANSGTQLSNYTLPTSASGSIGAVTPAPLTAALTGTSSKVYDGGTSATLAASNFALTGFVNSEGASVSKTSGTLDTANVGTSKAVTTTLGSSDFAANSGTDLSNYTTPTSASGSIGSVTPAPLSATLTGSSSKVYDGATSAALTASNFALTGFVNSEDASVSKTSGTLDTANVGSSKTVTTALGSGDFAANSGTQLTNYTLPTSASGNIGSVTPAPLTVSASNARKTYDGAAYTGGNGVAYSGFVNNETPGVLGGTLAYTGSSQGARNAGSYVITPAGLSSSNYAVSFANGSLSVTPAPLTVTAVTNTKSFDGNVQAQAVPVVSGLKGADAVTNLSEAYADANPGTGKNLSVQSGYQIVDGNNGNNYVVTLVSSQTGEIRSLPVAVLAPTLAVAPTGNSAPPTLTVLASSSASSSSASSSSASSSSSGSAGGGSSAGVSVSTINSPSQQVTGLVAVLVPSGTATAGTGLVIALPEQVMSPAASGAAVQVTLPNNQPLPDWIRYDAATQTLVTSAVPAGAFPLSVVVTVGGQSTVVQISESQSNS
jgi:hypothetical protein